MRYTGKIAQIDIQHRAPKHRTVTVEIDATYDRLPPVGGRVELHVEYTDEEIGRRFRRILAGSDKTTVEELAGVVENDAGWPILADLVRDVGL
jgi:hypothetical protein